MRKNRKNSEVPNSISPLRMNDLLVASLWNEEDREYLRQVDERGERILTKKEAGIRAFEISRWRSMLVGDLCCCKVSPQDDHWMVGRVAMAWNPPPGASYKSIAAMKPAERAAVLDKVAVLDADTTAQREGQQLPMHVMDRGNVLPLPRSVLEAAQWGSRYKKKTPLLAVYPDTTTLYPATAVDNSTYCRGDDDVVVCEFKDDGGAKRHVLARHVTLYPEGG
jgi:hypothetical protein